MTKKKKLKFIFATILFIILLILIFLFLKLNQEPAKNNECKIIDKVELVTTDNVPSLKNFTENCGNSGTIEFYENNEKITLENLKKGTYQVKIIIDDKNYSSILIVNDIDITLELQDLTINEGTNYDVNMFIKSCVSNSSECNLSFTKNEMGNYKEPGTYNIEIIAKNDHNETRSNVNLTIIENENDITESSNNIPTNSNTNSNNISTNNNVNSNGHNNNNNTSNNQNTTNNTPIVKINTISEETRNNSYKYGSTITTITTTYYDLYSDNSKVKTGETSRYEYDYSTFNAQTNDLKAEAASLVNNNKSFLNEIVSYVNQYRNELGISNITLDNDLSIAATVRALEMGWANKFDHTRPNGTSCFTVVDELGIFYFTVGENIAMGYTSPSAVSNGWRNSQGHYENMINANFNKIGVGLAIVNGTYYWVQLFTN